MNRVNLFLVGVNKAGTSWLYYLLDQHPSVFMADMKELYFFGDIDAYGPDDLEAYHAHFPLDQPFEYFGDATVMYYRNPQVADRIRTYNPAARALAIVRDPIRRLRSQFQYHKQLGHVAEGASLGKALDGNRPLVRDSHYEQTLPPFRERFGPDRFRIVSLEEGRRAPASFWAKVQDFLDLSPVPVPDTEERPKNPTGSPWFRRLYRATIPPIREHAPGLYTRMLESPLIHRAKKTLLSLFGTANREALPPALHERLREEFAPTYAYLQRLGFEAYDPEEAFDSAA